MYGRLCVYTIAFVGIRIYIHIGYFRVQISLITEVAERERRQQSLRLRVVGSSVNRFQQSWCFCLLQRKANAWSANVCLSQWIAKHSKGWRLYVLLLENPATVASLFSFTPQILHVGSETNFLRNLEHLTAPSRPQQGHTKAGTQARRTELRAVTRIVEWCARMDHLLVVESAYLRTNANRLVSREPVFGNKKRHWLSRSILLGRMRMPLLGCHRHCGCQILGGKKTSGLESGQSAYLPACTKACACPFCTRVYRSCIASRIY